jgi:hypothetical protein
MNTDNGVDDAAPNEATDDSSGNLSIEDLSSLFAGRSDAEEQPEDTAQLDSDEEPLEEPDELTGEEDGEEEEEVDPTTEPDEEDSDEAADGQDVLSKYKIDPETISDEDAKAINKALGGRFHKRVDQMFAKMKAAEEALEAYKQDNPKAEQKSSESLSDVGSLDDLSGKERELEKQARTIQRILRNDPQIDDDGDEYIYEENGNKYTREQVEGWLDVVETDLDAVPDRRKFLVEKEQANKLADQYFPELNDPDMPYLERYEKLQADPAFKPLFKMANAKYLIGLAFLGEETLLKAQQAANGKTKGTGKPQAVRPKAPPAPTGVALSRSTITTKKQKAKSQAKSKFASSNSLDDLAAYFEQNLD